MAPERPPSRGSGEGRPPPREARARVVPGPRDSEPLPVLARRRLMSVGPWFVTLLPVSGRHGLARQHAEAIAEAPGREVGRALRPQEAEEATLHFQILSRGRRPLADGRQPGRRKENQDPTPTWRTQTRLLTRAEESESHGASQSPRIVRYKLLRVVGLSTCMDLFEKMAFYVSF